MFSTWSRRIATLAIAAAFAAPLGSTELRADPGRSGEIDPEQRAAIERIIRDYLGNNPEVVIEAIQSYRAEQEANDRRSAVAALADSRDELERDPATPVIGNPDGDVTIVEFFDYRCGYCKRVLPTIQALLKEDGRIRYVLKEYPILGPDSVTAARASMAVWKVAPDRYMDFHVALLSSRGRLSETRVLGAAETLGIDVEAVRAEMGAPWIDEALRKNYRLGRRLNINGTPAFVVGEQIVPGAIDGEAMRALVDDAREG